VIYVHGQVSTIVDMGFPLHKPMSSIVDIRSIDPNLFLCPGIFNQLSKLYCGRERVIFITKLHYTKNITPNFNLTKFL